MHIVIDLLLLAIVIICVWSGWRKGFVIGIANLLGIVVALYGAVLVSSAFSYDVVPALKPFVSGYMERQMSDTVLENMDLADTDLSYEDILAADSELRHEFCARATRASASGATPPTRWRPRPRNTPTPTACR